MSHRVHTDNLNGIQTAKVVPATKAQQTGLKEDVQLPLTHIRVSSSACLGQGKLRPPWFHPCVPPHLQDNTSEDADPEDPDQDSLSESGSSLDNQDDWALVYRPHFSSHGNQLPLKGQHLSDAEEARQAERGDKTKET